MYLSQDKVGHFSSHLLWALSSPDLIEKYSVLLSFFDYNNQFDEILTSRYDPWVNQFVPMLDILVLKVKFWFLMSLFTQNLDLSFICISFLIMCS